MIVCELFPGDSIRIATIQHAVYDESLSAIFQFAKKEYKRSERVLGLQTELGLKFDCPAFDHRTLQWFHDSIAGQFRFNYCLRGDLFEQSGKEANDPADIVLRWKHFLHDELQRLFGSHDELARQIGRAVSFANPNPVGMEAEEYLYQLTLSEYPEIANRSEMTE